MLPQHSQGLPSSLQPLTSPVAQPHPVGSGEAHAVIRLNGLSCCGSPPAGGHHHGGVSPGPATGQDGGGLTRVQVAQRARLAHRTCFTWPRGPSVLACAKQRGPHVLLCHPDCTWAFLALTTHWCQRGTFFVWCAPAGLTEQACPRPCPASKQTFQTVHSMTGWMLQAGRWCRRLPSGADQSLQGKLCTACRCCKADRLTGMPLGGCAALQVLQRDPVHRRHAVRAQCVHAAA